MFTFSLYWFSHLLRLASLQSFDPILLNTILERFLIPLSKSSNVLKSSRNPIILKEIAQMINSFNVWEEIMTTLKYTLYRKKDQPVILNDKLKEKQREFEIFNVLKLFRTLLRLTNYLREHEETII
jgi:hypothetical protein